MTPQFNPTTWIDQQREAGAARSNVFGDILSAAEAYRRRDRNAEDARMDRRIARREQIRREAAHHDRQIDPRGVEAPTFDDMVKRWKAGA